MAEDVRAEIVASVLEVVVSEGDQIGEGDTLVLLESMKMEIPVLAEVAGTISKVSVAVGDVIQAGDLIAICCNARISDVFAIMEACGKHRRPVYRMPKRGKMVYGSESLSLVSAAHGMLQLEKLGVFVHMDEVLSATKAFIHSSRGKEGLITDEEIDILWLDRTRKRRNEEHRVSCPSAEISERFDDAVWQSATGHTMNLRTEGDQLVLRAFSPKAAHDRRGAGQRHCGPSPHVHGETGIPVF